MLKFFYIQTRRLLWAIPTLLLVLAIDYAFHNGLWFPMPFLLVFFSVIIAGSNGGILTGALAGLIGAATIYHSYNMGVGPDELTGALPQTLIASFTFIAAGAFFGRTKDKADATTARLHRIQNDLKRSVEIKATESDQAAAKIVEKDDWLRQAMQLSGIGFFRWNLVTGNCVFCTEQHAAHFGLDVDVYKDITKGPAPYVEFVHEEDRPQFLAAVGRVDTGEPLSFEFRIIRPNGDVRYIRQIAEPTYDDAGKIVEVVGSSIDLTELRESEDRTHRLQRMETIGNLTGGVAHDFNNLLAIILGNLELSILSQDPKDKNELIGEAIKATHRGADLTKSLLSFARRAHLTPTRINLNQLLNNTVIWSSRVLPETISIETSLAAGLWDTNLDASSAENAIINLLLNARDAMPQGGRLTLETANMRIGNEYIGEREEDIAPGRYVMLAISDTGHGIERDKFEKIFEPFYTGKKVGDGTGLGLSMVHGFIKQSEGAVRVYSEIGVGTTFKLYFKAEDEKIKPKSPLVDIPPKQVEKNVKILLAEDEEAVARVIRHSLENAGHSVTSALTGDDAFEIFKTAGPFDILLTDIVMPGTLQGPALAKAIRTIDPDFPCIFLSGYASEATVHGNGLKPSDIRLTKPVARDVLLAAVWEAAELIDAKSEPPE